MQQGLVITVESPMPGEVKNEMKEDKEEAYDGETRPLDPDPLEDFLCRWHFYCHFQASPVPVLSVTPIRGSYQEWRGKQHMLGT